MAEQCQNKSANVCNERPTTVSGWQLDGRLPAPSPRQIRSRAREAFKVKIAQRFRGSISKKKNRKRDAFEDSECRVLKSKSLCFPVTEERRAHTFRLEYFNHDFDKRRILSCLLTLEKGRI